MTARLSSAVGVVLASARVQLLVLLGAWRIPVVLGVVQASLLLLVVLALPAQVTPAYASRAAAGVLLISFWSATVWTGAGILQRERAEGTLAPCMAAVRDFRLVLVGKALGASGASALITGTTITVVLVAVRQPLHVAQPGWLGVGLLAVLLSGLTFGVGLSSLFVRTRFAPQLSAVLLYPVFLLGGLLTPLSSIPAGVRWLSWGVSLRWGMAFLASAISGTADMFALLMLIGTTAAYAVVAALAFNRFSIIARTKGTIDHV
ncbi:ABC transporter permease [Phytohabitans suffuscus]